MHYHKEEIVRSLLVVAVVGALGFLVGCGGNGTPAGVPITISLSPASASVNAGQTVGITATVSNDPSNKGVTWTLAGVGGDSLTSATSTSVTYNAPSSVTKSSLATVTATAAASSSVTASVQITVLPAGAANNIQPISVNGGPVAGSIYPNGAFTSVTICVPGTSNCQTIDGILVDTGSFGLRILASQITIPLPVLTNASNDELNNCVQFLDGSFLWGLMESADIALGGEIATATSTSLPNIQAIANPTGYTIPSNCSSGGTGVNEDTQQLLGANGILGVGPEPFDCGSACDSGSSIPEPFYYLCSTSNGCAATFVSCGPLCGDSAPNQQLTNPVFNFPTDNNGVILDLPAVAGVAATVDGNMIFGIGTQSNNGLGTAQVFTLDQNDNFETQFNNQNLTGSFIDSGSNGLFFPDSSLPICPGSDSSWYCPTSTTPLLATNVGLNQATSTVNFSVDNFETVTTGNPGDAAFSNLAGPNAGGFDWGLPFFYGRKVFTAIDGTTTPAGNGPYWAY
jgi:hypothetical protein